MSCPHYSETEKVIGSLTLLVCRDCGARLAADAEIIEAEPMGDLLEALADEAQICGDDCDGSCAFEGDPYLTDVAAGYGAGEALLEALTSAD